MALATLNNDEQLGTIRNKINSNFAELDANTAAEGLSAYGVAAENGFVGSEQEWLDSLVGTRIFPLDTEPAEAPEGMRVGDFLLNTRAETAGSPFCNGGPLYAGNIYMVTQIDAAGATPIRVGKSYGTLRGKDGASGTRILKEDRTGTAGSITPGASVGDIMLVTSEGLSGMGMISNMKKGDMWKITQSGPPNAEFLINIDPAGIQIDPTEYTTILALSAARGNGKYYLASGSNFTDAPYPTGGSPNPVFIEVIFADPDNRLIRVTDTSGMGVWVCRCGASYMKSSWVKIGPAA